MIQEVRHGAFVCRLVRGRRTSTHVRADADDQVLLHLRTGQTEPARPGGLGWRESRDSTHWDRLGDWVRDRVSDWGRDRVSDWGRGRVRQNYFSEKLFCNHSYVIKPFKKTHPRQLNSLERRRLVFFRIIATERRGRSRTHVVCGAAWAARPCRLVPPGPASPRPRGGGPPRRTAASCPGPAPCRAPCHAPLCSCRRKTGRRAP